MAFETFGQAPSGAIKFNSIKWQVGTGYDGSTGIFTAPVDGIYHVDAAYTSTATTSVAIGTIYLNGTGYMRFGRQSNTVNEAQPGVSIKMKLKKGDQVSIIAGGTVGNLEAGWSWYSVVLLNKTYETS